MNDDQPTPELDLAGVEALLGRSDVANDAHADLAAVLDGLRQPARPAELAAATHLVPQLAAAVNPPAVTGVIARSSRRMVLIGAAGAMLAGGVAAAASGVLDPILPSAGPSGVVEVSPDPAGDPRQVVGLAEIAETVDATAGDGEPTAGAGLGAAIVPARPDDAPEWLTDDLYALCADPEASHGDFVSGVAGLPADQLGENALDRGAVVSEAARDKNCDGQADGAESHDDEGPDAESGSDNAKSDPSGPDQAEPDRNRAGENGGRAAGRRGSEEPLKPDRSDDQHADHDDD